MGELKIKKKIMIIAGEASGDKHGAKLVMAMREKRDDLFFCGIGGEALQAAGVKIIVHASQLCVVGITEVFSKIPSILKGLAAARRLIQTLKPDLLILIDFPDFNLHVAGAAKKNGIPVLYYISPQIWAWRKGRIKKIGELVDHMALILPFEEKYYKKHAIPASFVGHPLLDDNSAGNKSGFQKEPDLVLGILPGSRNSEIIRHLPVMLDAADLLSAKNRDLKVIVSVAGTVDKSLVNRIFGDYKGNTKFEIHSGSVDEVIDRSRIVVAASGTVTLETAISGTPMVIIYKISPLSYMLGRALIKVENIGLVNLIAGKKIVPELIQGDASPEKIADTLYNMLSNPVKLESVKKELLGIKDLLGGPGASMRVAEIALDLAGN